VVFPCSADEADSSAILVGDHPPAVVLLFVDPALAVERPGDFIRLHGGDMREAHPPCLPVTTRRSSRLDRVRHVRATTTRDPGPVTLNAAFQIAAVSMLQDGWLRGRPEADPPWGGETSTLRMISARGGARSPKGSLQLLLGFLALLVERLAVLAKVLAGRASWAGSRGIPLGRRSFPP
jgi:hypothetical protein